MVDVVERPAYREQLHALLPSGRAWSEDTGTVLDSFLDAIASQLAEVDRAGANMLDEIRPSTTLELLPDWERVAGLPDSCSVLGSTIAIRRASLLEKLVTKPTLNPSEFVRIGRTFGVEITVDELDQTRADAVVGLDTTGGKWRFVWWITIPTTADIRYFDTLSDVNTPLVSIERNTEMECRLQKAAPAHTHLIIGYATVLALPAQADDVAYRNLAYSLVLPEAVGGSDPYTYTLTGSLPAGLAFDAASRTISGIPSALGSAALTYTVEDDAGATESVEFSLDVQNFSLERALPAFTEPFTDRIRFQNLDDGFADVSDLSATAGDESHVVFFELRGNGADSANRALFRTEEAPDGSSGTSVGPDMLAAWERAGVALIVQAEGLNDLSLAGPNNANVATGDSTEPYAWVPGDNYTNGAISYIDSAGLSAGLTQWVADFKALTQDQQATSTLTITMVA